MGSPAAVGGGAPVHFGERLPPEKQRAVYEQQSLNRDNQPVVLVSCVDATRYANWLSGKGNGTFHLPTAAQWEYAARAGTKTKQYWGDDPDQACQYANVADETWDKEFSVDRRNLHKCNDGYVLTAPVGKFRPNAFGLYDMLGMCLSGRVQDQEGMIMLNVVSRYKTGLMV